MITFNHFYGEFFKARIDAFKRNLQGSVLMTAGILMPVVMLGCALAIEYSMATRISSKIQNVADAALMAAVVEIRTLDDLDNEAEIKAKLEAKFEDFFIANMDDRLPPSFEVSRLEYDPDTNQVRTVISYDYVHTFYRITSGSAETRHKQQVESEIGLTTKSKRPLSMLMVLDKSGSMGEDNRMNSLKTAVASMTETLNESDPDRKYIRTGTVFYDTKASPLSIGWGSNASNDAVQAQSSYGGTDSSLAMRRAVNRLHGHSEEHKHAKRNSGNPRKVILFLTDGNNNRTISDTKTINACNKAKTNDNIEIYTIAFQAPSRGQKLLRNCATSAEHYFNSTNSAELIAAFEKIAEFESGKLAFSR